MHVNSGLSLIDILFHESFGILNSLMHELSKKPGKIFRKANSLMHELSKKPGKIFREGLNPTLTKYFTRFFTAR
jgi:hypothetical protein